MQDAAGCLGVDCDVPRYVRTKQMNELDAEAVLCKSNKAIFFLSPCACKVNTSLIFLIPKFFRTKL